MLTDLYTATEAMLRVDDVFLIGDYNDDGAVNAADYTVWRDLLGTAVALPNETVTPGMVTSEDYDQWKAHFGNTFGGGAGALHNGAVPEPGTLFLLAWGACVWPLGRSVRCRIA